jgi:superfamily II DNA or RNA helicase
MPTIDARTLLESLPWSLRTRTMGPSGDQVTILEDGPEGIIAAVSNGSRHDHEVELDLRGLAKPGEPPTVVAWCPCTDFRHAGRCAHVTAVLAHLTAGSSRPPALPAQQLVAGSGPVFPSRPPWERRLRSIAGHAERLAASAPKRPSNLPEGRAVELVLALDGAHTEREGAPVFGLWGSWPRANGTIGTLRRVPIDDLDDLAGLIPLGMPTAPFTILQHASRPPWSGGRHARTADAGVLRLIVPELAALGALRITRGDKRPEQGLRWSTGVWRFEIVGEVEDGRLRLRPMLSDGISRRAPAEALYATEGLVVFADLLAPFETNPATVTWFKRGGLIEVPAEDVEPAIELAAQIVGRANLALPAGLAWPVETLELRPRLVVQLQGSRVVVRGEARYGALGNALGVGAEQIVDEVERRLIRRDLLAEGVLAERLEALLEAAGEPLGVEAVAALATTLDAGGWELSFGGKRLRIARTPQLGVATGVDWFDLSVAVSFGDEVSLTGDQALALAGQTTVDLPDGSVGLVTEGLAGLLGKLERLARPGPDGARRLNDLDVLLLDELAAERAQLELDGGAQAARARLLELAKAEPMAEPPGFVGVLRPYQRVGAGWLVALERAGIGGCLADDMGLGKTVQVLAFLAARRSQARGPSLVVAPRSLVETWLSEARRFVPEMEAVDLSRADREQQLERLAPGTIAITTWGVLRRDAPQWANEHFDVVVFDEAQAAKNRDAVSSKAGRALDARVRIALTGTPIENHLGELGAIVELVNPGMVGRFESLSLLAGARREADSDELAGLARALRPILLRRRKDDVLPDLPPRTEQVLLCELSGRQERLYRALLARTRREVLERVKTQGMGRSAFHVLEALLRLRQAACHPGLIDPSHAAEGGGKLELLLERLAELAEEGHKALVFSQFTSLLDLVEPRLEHAHIGFTRLDGRTRDREARIRRFREDPECVVFLVSLKAGGVGLTLTEASYVFLLDPWWNPAAEAQAIDRTHRIGQERPVFAYRLVARDTIEERILALQEQKRALADAVLAGDRGPLASLGIDELEALLS